MKYLLIALLFPVIGMGQFPPPEPVGTFDLINLQAKPSACKHIYVEIVESHTRPAPGKTRLDSLGYVHYSGRDLVCVKCFDMKKEKIGFGWIGSGSGGYAEFTVDSTSKQLRLSTKAKIWQTASEVKCSELKDHKKGLCCNKVYLPANQ
jgi:hypothetical protein